MSDYNGLRRRLVAASAMTPSRFPLPTFPPAMQADLFLSRWTGSARHGDQEVIDWINCHRGLPRLRAVPSPLDQLDHWQIDPHSGNIVHESGRFFSITGVRVRHRYNLREVTWDQPIIDQPEVGILGILAKSIDGVLHFCLQAKEEPGNIGGVQLSPTIQATYSNYTTTHGGARPLFLEHFLNPAPWQVLFARLQTEDGGRFLYKSNRNMIVLLPEDSDETLPKAFIWLTLRQIALLLRQHNLLHATTRSILAALFCCCNSPVLMATAARAGVVAEPPVTEACRPEILAESIGWLDQWKANHHFLVRRIGLSALDEWHFDAHGFLSHREDRFFRIIGLNISGADREVSSWSQPILCNPEIGVVGLLTRERSGRRQYLMQAKAEIGNRNLVQLAPTVQFTPGNYLHNPRLEKPFLFDDFQKHSRFPSLFETLQSEEGARFFREAHQHRILCLPDHVDLNPPADYRWLDQDEIGFFLHFGDLVNSCARSILACLL